MKILMVSPDLNYPPIYGGRIRRYNLLKYLSKENDITLMAFIESNHDLGNIKGIKEFCRKIETVRLGSHSKIGFRIVRIRNYILSKFFNYPPIVLDFHSNKMKKKIKRQLARDTYDLVLIEYWYLGQFADGCDGIIKVLDEHDIEHRRWYRLYEFNRKKEIFSLFKRTMKFELRTLRKFDKILSVTENDRAYLLEKCGNALDVSVIPTGVDTVYFKPGAGSNQSENLVFVGSLRHVPNIDGIVFFCREIFPLILKKMPAVRLFIVGLSPVEEVQNLANENITVTGFVEDIRPYVYRSSVFIVPIRFGTGIRGKILEAMALRKPVIATSVAVTGLEVKHGQNIIIADDPKGFADWTVELLGNKSLSDRLTSNAARLIDEKYRWEKIIPELNDILAGLVSRKYDAR